MANENTNKPTPTFEEQEAKALADFNKKMAKIAKKKAKAAGKNDDSSDTMKQGKKDAIDALEKVIDDLKILKKAIKKI